jgi:hypothetical protein
MAEKVINAVPLIVSGVPETIEVTGKAQTQSFARRKFEKIKNKFIELFFSSPPTNCSPLPAQTQTISSECNKNGQMTPSKASRQNSASSMQTVFGVVGTDNNSTISNYYYGYKSHIAVDNEAADGRDLNECSVCVYQSTVNKSASSSSASGRASNSLSSIKKQPELQNSKQHAQYVADAEQKSVKSAKKHTKQANKQSWLFDEDINNNSMRSKQESENKQHANDNRPNTGTIDGSSSSSSATCPSIKAAAKIESTPKVDFQISAESSLAARAYSDTASASEPYNPFLDKYACELLTFAGYDIEQVKAKFEPYAHLIDEEENFFDLSFMTNYVAYILLIKLSSVASALMAKQITCTSACLTNSSTSASINQVNARRQSSSSGSSSSNNNNNNSHSGSSTGDRQIRSVPSCSSICSSSSSATSASSQFSNGSSRSDEQTNLLKEIARNIYLESESEPCGLKGCKMNIYTDDRHLISQFRFDSSSQITTFELELVLKYEQAGGDSGISGSAMEASWQSPSSGYSLLSNNSQTGSQQKIANLQQQTPASPSLSPFATLTRRLLSRNKFFRGENSTTTANTSNSIIMNNECELHKQKRNSSNMIFIEASSYELLKRKLY